MVTLRYSVRKNDHGAYWSVVDIFTGQPAWHEGVRLDRLEVDEVDDLVDLLNGIQVKRYGSLRQR